MSEMDRSVGPFLQDFAWAVHDFQRLADSISFLVVTVGTADDLDTPRFYTNVDSLTNSRQLSRNGQRMAAVMSDEDRSALRKLKSTRDLLFYKFFLQNKVLRDQETVAIGVFDAFREIREDLDRGIDVVRKLLTAISAE